MHLERFSIKELEKELEAIELVEEKIKLIAYEMMRCKMTIQDIADEVRNIDPSNIKLTAKVNCNDTSILDILNTDKELKNTATKEISILCGKKLCKQLKSFLKKAQIDYEYYQTEMNLKGKCSGLYLDSNKKENDMENGERIIWMCGKDKLLRLFSGLKEKNILVEYSAEEILAHFCNEKQISFAHGINNTEMFRWRKSDNSFSFFVDELAKRNCIEEVNKYMVLRRHFLNKEGKPFKDLAQKKYNTKNFTRTGDLIEKILNSIKYTAIIVLYWLLSVNDTLLEDVANNLAPFILT